MGAADTSETARRVQDDLYRSMTPTQRVELALGMAEDGRAILLDAIRARRPRSSDEELRHDLLVVLHGEAVAELVTGRPTR